jgi:hypothetical protein
VAAALAHRGGAAGLAVTLGAISMMLGAGTAEAASREVVCRIDGSLPAPVTLTEGDQAQLVLVVPALGTRVTVGPAQSPSPGSHVLSAAVQGVLGVADGTVCRAVVQVQAAVASVAPLPPPPPVAPPTLPPLAPSQSVRVPLPGAEVSVETGSPPGGQAPPPASRPGAPATSGSTAGSRFDVGRLYGFSSVSYGMRARFGAAAPALRFGQNVPGYAPELGVLDGAAHDTGTVRALPPRGAPARLPVLLAVLLLATVSAVLVRAWTLRRAGRPWRSLGLRG